MLHSNRWQYVKNIYIAVIKSVLFLSYRKLMKNPNVWLWSHLNPSHTDVKLKMPIKLPQNYTDKELYSIEPYYTKSNAKEI